MWLGHPKRYSLARPVIETGETWRLTAPDALASFMQERMGEDWTVKRNSAVTMDELGEMRDERDKAAAYAGALREALESARDGFINLRPDSGPMHRQMTKHIIAIDAALAAKPQGANGSAKAAGAPGAESTAAPTNDRETLERAIAYCEGQTMADSAENPEYDKGVAACVRMLEDMMPYGDEPA